MRPMQAPSSDGGVCSDSLCIRSRCFSNEFTELPPQTTEAIAYSTVIVKMTSPPCGKSCLARIASANAIPPRSPANHIKNSVLRGNWSPLKQLASPPQITMRSALEAKTKALHKSTVQSPVFAKGNSKLKSPIPKKINTSASKASATAEYAWPTTLPVALLRLG